MTWVKLHTDILGDPKLIRAAREGRKGLALLPWLIAFAKEADVEGRLSVNGAAVESVDLVRLIPGATRKRVAEALASLEAIGVLVRDDDKVLRFVAWERRQTRPSDGPEANRERQKRFRERQKALRHNTERNDVTRYVTSVSNAPEEKRGEEKRKEESTVAHDRDKATADDPKDEKLRGWVERMRTQPPTPRQSGEPTLLQGLLPAPQAANNSTGRWCVHGDYAVIGPDGACNLCKEAGSP